MKHPLPVNTPCIGLCSTVFGDSVCRGCLRHVHEIIDWNRYSPEQRQLIWQRLDQQIASVLPRWIVISDLQQMQQWMLRHRLPSRRPDHERNVYRNVYDILRFSERRNLPLRDCGFILPADAAAEMQQQLYALACAYYERDHLRAHTRLLPRQPQENS